MAIDYEAHWTTFYQEMRTAMDVGGHTTVPIFHVTSENDQTGDPSDPPYVIYAQETERPVGTTGGGNSTVLRSGFRITARAVGLADALAYISDIVNALDTADDTMVTADGYRTTDISILGVQSLYESDFGVYAVHLRVDWERSR